jgi:hypothetical protein
MRNIDRAYETAGFRERYAIEHGKKGVYVDSRKHEMWVFNYSVNDPYQDANGATYDVTERRWIG